MKIIALYDNYEPQQFDGKVYLMADSSLAKSGKPWFLPEFAPEFTYQTHIVIRIGRLGKNIARRFAHRYVDAVTVGATVTACGIADNAIAKAFDGAAMIGDFLPIEQISDLNEINASLANGDIDLNAFQHKAYLNKEIAQCGYKIEAIGDTLIAPLSLYSKKAKSVDELKELAGKN